MIGGNLGNCTTFIIATILLAKFPPGVADNNAASWGFIVVTWAYNFSFSATCGPLSCEYSLGRDEEKNARFGLLMRCVRDCAS